MIGIIIILQLKIVKRIEELNHSMLTSNQLKKNCQSAQKLINLQKEAVNIKDLLQIDEQFEKPKNMKFRTNFKKKFFKNHNKIEENRTMTDKTFILNKSYEQVAGLSITKLHPQVFNHTTKNGFKENKLPPDENQKREYLNQRITIGRDWKITNQIKIKKNQQEKIFSAYNLHQMFSFYNSLLKYSKGSLQTFKKGFQVMLNLQSISIRQEIIRQCFKDNMKSLSFVDFLSIYSRIDKLIFQQTIIDYMDILFENCNKSKISYEEIYMIFKKRCNHQDAQERASVIYQKIGKQKKQMVNIEQIYNICSNDNAYCLYMHALYVRDILMK